VGCFVNGEEIKEICKLICIYSFNLKYLILLALQMFILKNLERNIGKCYRDIKERYRNLSFIHHFLYKCKISIEYSTHLEKYTSYKWYSSINLHKVNTPI
jgi:hypothetical protein